MSMEKDMLSLSSSILNDIPNLILLGLSKICVSLDLTFCQKQIQSPERRKLTLNDNTNGIGLCQFI